jgi:Flp pilus assembly protein TadD
MASTGALAQQAKMYGTVVDEAGVGAPNVKVILEPISAGNRVEIVSKGKKGSYLFGIIRPGRYALKVEAPGLALVNIRAEATALNQVQKKEQKWKLDGRVRLDKPTEIEVEDGMEITCDLVVGTATEITTPTGDKAIASGDQAYALLAKQVQQGDCAGALPQIEKFTTDNPQNGRAFYLKGFCAAVLERDDEALAALTKSLELDPGFAGTNTLIGKIHARNKRLPEAEGAFKKEIEATNIRPEILVDALLSLGAVERDQKRETDAIATFEKAVAAAPTRPEAYVELSALYAQTGQTDKAAAILEKAKDVGADDPLALLNVGISYFNKKDYAHAETMFRRVIESKATNSDMAMAYGLLGSFSFETARTTTRLRPSRSLSSSTPMAVSPERPRTCSRRSSRRRRSNRGRGAFGAQGERDDVFGRRGSSSCFRAEPCGVPAWRQARDIQLRHSAIAPTRLLPEEHELRRQRNDASLSIRDLDGELELGCHAIDLGDPSQPREQEEGAAGLEIGFRRRQNPRS